MVIRFTYGNLLGSLVLLCLFLTSCGSDVPFPRCVSAENFSGGTTVAVSAYFGEGNVDAFRAENGALGNGSVPGATKQLVRWQDTGLVTDGNEIVAKIQGAWIPWEKHGNSSSSQISVNTGISRPADLSNEFYDSVVDIDRVCGPYEKNVKKVGNCDLQCFSIPAGDQTAVGKYGRPCWLEQGYGAYLLFKKPGDEDPNATLDIIEFPKSPTTHLGYEGAQVGGEAMYHSDTNGIYDIGCKKIKPQAGWKIYVKILDNYYYDNAGGYSLEFTKGVVRGKNTDIFEYVRKLVRGELDKAGQGIFKNITSNKTFKNLVYAIITLFLVVTSLVYVMGMVRTPLVDLIVRLLKVILVLLLISPNSWDFFYNHLLQMFIKGVDEIIAIINGYAIGQEFRADTPFSFMDIMIRDRIFSPVVWEAKARALITADWSSIFALLIIIIAVLFYIGLCMYGFVIYLTAFVGITFLISLMPILFIGALFSRFRSLFDGWLTQCISFSMQAILMFTLIAMFGTLIMHYYYRIFGFTACYNEWMHLKFLYILDKKFYEWTPGQKYDSIKIGWSGVEKRSYPAAGTTARYSFTGGGAVIKVPPDYKYKDFRYVDYPFLDPDTKSSTVYGGVVLKDSVVSSTLAATAPKVNPMENLATLTNMLVAAERANAIARIVSRIEKELEVLEKSQHVGTSAKKTFADLVDKARASTNQTRWDEPGFKTQLVSVLASQVLTNHTVPGTPLKDLEKQYDYNIIKNIKQGWIVMWSEVFGLILVTFLIWQMRAFVQNVAVMLSGGGMMSQTVGSMYSEGFARIFSSVPVLGRVIETVDRGVDGVRMFARSKIMDVVGGAASAPEKLLGRVPVVGGAFGAVMAGMRRTASALTASYTEEEMYSMKSISPRFDYATAWLGAHLGLSPLDAMKYVGSFSVGKLTGSTSGSIMKNIRQDRATLLKNLRALTIGVDKHKPSKYVPAKADDDTHNPFRRADSAMGKGKHRHKGDDSLFGDKGGMHINRHNFWEAVDTLHGLKVMLKHAKDEKAALKIREDIQRLKDEINVMSYKAPDRVPELSEYIFSPGSVDFDGLEARALERRGVIGHDKHHVEQVHGFAQQYDGDLLQDPGDGSVVYSTVSGPGETGDIVQEGTRDDVREATHGDDSTALNYAAVEHKGLSGARPDAAEVIYEEIQKRSSEVGASVDDNQEPVVSRAAGVEDIDLITEDLMAGASSTVHDDGSSNDTTAGDNGSESEGFAKAASSSPDEHDKKGEGETSDHDEENIGNALTSSRGGVEEFLGDITEESGKDHDLGADSVQQRTEESGDPVADDSVHKKDEEGTEQQTPATTEEDDDDYSDAFARMFDENQTQGAGDAEPDQDDDDYSDAFARLFSEDTEEGAANEDELGGDEYSEAFARLFSEDTEGGADDGEEDDDYSDDLAKLFDENPDAGEAAEEDDDYSEAFARMFDESEAAKDHVEHELEHLDDHSEEFTKLFDEEKLHHYESPEALHDDYGSAYSAEKAAEEDLHKAMKKPIGMSPKSSKGGAGKASSSGSGRSESTKEESGGIYELKKKEPKAGKSKEKEKEAVASAIAKLRKKDDGIDVGALAAGALKSALFKGLGRGKPVGGEVSDVVKIIDSAVSEGAKERMEKKVTSIVPDELVSSEGKVRSRAEVTSKDNDAKYRRNMSRLQSQLQELRVRAARGNLQEKERADLNKRIAELEAAIRSLNQEEGGVDIRPKPKSEI
ncbi:type IV secretion system protein [Candidatus Anaplasma sp. TIGMIC]|uniref:type IV secretion system protein n=1 Tax=Candidatus Anaplasma sp. TIGMIC TaxID=3020713 RepID=UPI00232D2F7F|nr:type IV secretion system protein [Candidatus Anaplasma sp. TIGMIC]MDB1134992.1 type IV secretion system protein [Candidatus Anaplasma sp. TIGMIC]